MKKRTITAALLITALSITPVFNSYSDTPGISESTSEALPTVPETGSTGIYTYGVTQADNVPTGSDEETTAETLTTEEILREQQNRAWLEEQ
ncbi:MAG: hypothetical protein J6M92_12725, partial [Oribacterium sp.]|nr:hypothetical protein [Oribacterium sp.]